VCACVCVRACVHACLHALTRMVAELHAVDWVHLEAQKLQEGR